MVIFHVKKHLHFGVLFQKSLVFIQSTLAYLWVLFTQPHSQNNTL